jgi:predicted DNA-binding ArsR family transcriptional regulator
MNNSGHAYDGEHDGDSDEWYEYASGYICLSCTLAALSNISEDVVIITDDEMREAYQQFKEKLKEKQDA